MLKHLKHILLATIMLVCWLAILVSIAAYAFLTTNWGAKIVANSLIQSYRSMADITIGKYEGTVEHGLVLKDVMISHIPTTKEGVILIQEIYVRVPLNHWDQVALKVINARFELKSSDPIIFNGEVNQNKITGTCYANSVDAKEVVDALGYTDLAKNIFGFISHIDLTIDGLVSAPEFKGRFFVDKFTFKDTTLSDGFGRLDLKITALGDNPMMSGYMFMDSAMVHTNKINVDLTTSKVNFVGEVTNLLLDIHGSTKVEDINIDMAIKGTFLKPILLFNSDPPMSEEQILMVLVTGKSWSGVDKDIAQGLGVRKKLSEAFNVGMEVQELPTPVGQSQSSGYTKTIEGSMNVTDHLSVNVAKRFLPTVDTLPSSANPQRQEKDNDTQWYLEYKKRF